MSCLTYRLATHCWKEPGTSCLLLIPNSPCGRYATWKVDRTGTGVHSGHYTSDIQVAVKSFVRRAKLGWDISPDRVNAL